MTEPLNNVDLKKMIADADLGTVSEVIERLASPLEVLAILIWLTANAAEQSEKVRLYMHIAEEQMIVVGQTVAAVGKALG